VKLSKILLALVAYFVMFFGILSIVGCGEDKNDGFDAAGNVIDENQLFTLESHYQFRMNGLDIIFWGVDEAFGKTNEHTASAMILTINRACYIRMLVKKIGAGLSNDYTIEVGSSDQDGAGCGQLRGFYSLTLTGATSADIEYIRNLDDNETF
jgi:hypothetical protein